ncbi:hypothetical protein [Streptomyces sp. CAU 1734]|uniref:hypothetical protein n=1 Tax=Streptomyces sp. CAU 1734 TaxID=3140360 RepID=UPI0032606E60
MPENASPTRRSRSLRRATGAAVLLTLAGYVGVQHITDRGAPHCVVRAGAGTGGPSYALSTEQAANAATIAAVGTTRGMPERAVTIALATALQESSLRNISHGDRDSLGLFQQRPSKGWGTTAQILDPVYSAGIFYDRLAEVPGYSRLPLTEAAQRVQRSGFPQAYAKHETNSALLAAALTGRAGAALTCVPDGNAGPGNPDRVRAELVRAFGPGVLPGRAGAAGSPAAREFTVPVSSARTGKSPDEAGKRGRQLAHWAMARADGLRIDEISYGDRIWSADRTGEGWRKSAGARPAGGAERDPAGSAPVVQLRIAH